MKIYRTHAAIAERIEKLESVKIAAEEFLLALHTEPGYPFHKEEALSAAIKEAHLLAMDTIVTIFQHEDFFWYDTASRKIPRNFLASKMIITQLNNKLVKDVPLQAGDIIYVARDAEWSRLHLNSIIIYVLGAGEKTESAKILSNNTNNEKIVNNTLCVDVIFLETNRKDTFHLTKSENFPSAFSFLVRAE